MAPTLAGEGESFIIKAARLVYNHVADRAKASGIPVTFTESELDVIWFTKLHDDWRILFRTPLQDNVFYRVTNDPHTRQVRIDAFQQFDQIVFDNKELR